ncbi:hypothetical protein V6N13_138080 [Hibiscus sabdariffa]|uniref:Uncharacterized protein n=1 Tax=Hibiscus sabdariffa TaxID=183260 RepID=A0ABR2QCJ5_9ROSI
MRILGPQQVEARCPWRHPGGIKISSLVFEPLETPLGNNKMMEGAGLRCWLKYVLSLEIETLEPSLGYKKLMVVVGLRCGCSHDNSLMFDPREPPLGLNEMRNEAGLGWGWCSELSESSKYGPERSPGNYVDHAASGKCWADRDRGCRENLTQLRNGVSVAPPGAFILIKMALVTSEGAAWLWPGVETVVVPALS